MKKLKLGTMNVQDILSREELRKVGGGDGSTVACPTTDGKCVTTDGVAGTCGYYMGIYGCRPGSVH